MKKKIYITGSAGLVGSRFLETLPEKYEPLSPEIGELDIRNEEALREFFNDMKPAIVVHFAAFTNVDLAERERGDEKGNVWKVNVEGTRNLAKLVAKRKNGFLVYISTDFVFPATEDCPGPYNEDSELVEGADKISWYGWTKLMAEKEISKVGGNFAIVRISYPYRAHFSGKPDFARNILTLFDKGELYPMFADQKITPTFIDELCEGLHRLLRLRKSGVYHIASSNLTSPYEFANYLLEKTRGVKRVVKKGSVKEYLEQPGRTPRPKVGGLESGKTQRILGIEFRTWQKAVDEFARQLQTS